MLKAKSSPAHTAVLFLPEFGALFRTRFIPLLAVGGLVMLTAAAALLTGLAAGQDGPIAAGSGLIGLGVGASVSPALFITGFSLRSAQIQRVFALVELLRGVTAFLAAPILLYLATAVGTSAGIWICLAITAGGGVTAVTVFALSGGRLQRPDLDRWTEGEPAWTSPPLLRQLLRQPSTRERSDVSVH